MRYLILLLIFVTNLSLACEPIRINSGKPDSVRLAEIKSSNNPHLAVINNIAKDELEKLVYLAVLESFDVQPQKIILSQSVYQPPLCMDDLDFMELVLISEDIFSIKVSDGELETVVSKGRSNITLESLIDLIRRKL